MAESPREAWYVFDQCPYLFAKPCTKLHFWATLRWHQGKYKRFNWKFQRKKLLSAVSIKIQSVLLVTAVKQRISVFEPPFGEGVWGNVCSSSLADWKARSRLPTCYNCTFSLLLPLSTNSQNRPLLKAVGQFGAKYWVKGLCLPLTSVHRYIAEWFYYNFSAGIFHIKKLCSRLYSTELEFCLQILFLSHPLGELGVTYALYL